MINFIDAKNHLRVDHTSDDADITLKLRLAGAIVEDYMGDTCSDSPTYADIKDAATLLVLGELYTNRESSADPLSPTVKAILERLRMPGHA